MKPEDLGSPEEGVAIEQKDRYAYAEAVLAAGDRWRKELDASNADCKSEMDTALKRFRLRMEQAQRIYAEEVQAARIKYRREE